MLSLLATYFDGDIEAAKKADLRTLPKWVQLKIHRNHQREWQATLDYLLKNQAEIQAALEKQRQNEEAQRVEAERLKMEKEKRMRVEACEHERAMMRNTVLVCVCPCVSFSCFLSLSVRGVCMSSSSHVKAHVCRKSKKLRGRSVSKSDVRKPV